MTNDQVRSQLLAEHEQLLRVIAGCEEMAEEVVSGRGERWRQLLARVIDLVDRFEEHNRDEESRLAPLLREIDSFGDVRVEQMVRDHEEEHLALRLALRAVVDVEVPDRAARDALDVLQRLRQHMAAEESQFLNERIIKDDLVAIDMFTG